MEQQLTFEYPTQVVFKKISGTCRCGYQWEYNRSNITLEMYVPCPNCSNYIRVGDTIQSN